MNDKKIGVRKGTDLFLWCGIGACGAKTRRF